MVKEYLGRPEARSFIQDMTASKEVQDSATSFLADTNVGAAVERIQRMPPLAEAPSAGAP